jgi:hypothetical protein
VLPARRRRAHVAGADGEAGACKDPVDCVRYLAITEVEYVDMASLGVRKRLRGAY